MTVSISKMCYACNGQVLVLKCYWLNCCCLLFISLFVFAINKKMLLLGIQVLVWLMFRKCYMLPFWNNRNFESQLYPTRVQITCWWCIRMVGLPRVWTYCACLSIWKTFVEESTNIVLTSNNLNTKQTLSSKTRIYMIYICGNETWWKCEICCLLVFWSEWYPEIVFIFNFLKY